jgi:hypothetical protein
MLMANYWEQAGCLFQAIFLFPNMVITVPGPEFWDKALGQ